MSAPNLRTADLKLVGTDGSRLYSWELTEGKHILGRKVECDFYIPNQTVSRRHAEIEFSNETVFVTDLGSHNGTTVNERPIGEKKEIKLGDRIVFGEVNFKLSEGDEPTTVGASSRSTQLAPHDPEKSVFLSINEALKPLPSNVTEIPEVLTTISDMARTLVLPEPREKMLSEALDLISRVIPSERLIILTVPEGSDEVIVEASNLSSGKDLSSITLSRTIIQDILQNKNAILIGNPMEDARYSDQQSIIMSELKSAMAVPLFDQGRVLGILYVDTTNPLHRYSNDFLKLLATFGNILASKLVNYALLAERAERQLIEAELKRASSIQKKLLDLAPQQVDGYSIHAYQDQCRAVGGDMYDYCQLPDGRLVILVADVSGKGMGAALLMANVLASLRILYQSPQFDLVQSVQATSTQLFKYSAPEDFVTLFVGIIDPQKNRLSYINAGHNPAVLVHSTGTTEYLEATGIMIGAFPGMVWDVNEIEMNIGDSVCVYTDGVTEAEGTTDQYGEERLLDCLLGLRAESPQSMTEKLMKNIEEFVSGCPQSDDITMLFVKREG